MVDAGCYVGFYIADSRGLETEKNVINRGRLISGRWSQTQELNGCRYKDNAVSR